MLQKGDPTGATARGTKCQGQGPGCCGSGLGYSGLRWPVHWGAGHGHGCSRRHLPLQPGLERSKVLCAARLQCTRECTTDTPIEFAHPTQQCEIDCVCTRSKSFNRTAYQIVLKQRDHVVVTKVSHDVAVAISVGQECAAPCHRSATSPAEADHHHPPRCPSYGPIPERFRRVPTIVTLWPSYSPSRCRSWAWWRCPRQGRQTVVAAAGPHHHQQTMGPTWSRLSVWS